MKTKILLSSVLIVLLPFCVQADYTYDYVYSPAVVANNGTVTRTDDSGPFVTAEVLPGDSTNVVSASYVKGAYNDTIAAINMLAETKQNAIENLTNYHGPMEAGALGSDGIIGALVDHNLPVSDGELYFVSASGVVNGILSQRVTAVDTWGSTHTVDVAFKTVQ